MARSDRKKGKMISITFGRKAEGICVKALRDGLYVDGWYDFDYVIAGGLLTWEQIEEMRDAIHGKTLGGTMNKTTFHCPVCGEDSEGQLDYVAPGAIYEWRCPKCGAEFEIEFRWEVLSEDE